MFYTFKANVSLLQRFKTIESDVLSKKAVYYQMDFLKVYIHPCILLSVGSFVSEIFTQQSKAVGNRS